jgi:hypothetical protein
MASAAVAVKGLRFASMNKPLTAVLAAALGWLSAARDVLNL